MLEIWLKVDHFLTQISASREKNKSQPEQHTVTLVIRVWLGWVGPGKQKENKAVKSVFTKKQR